MKKIMLIAAATLALAACNKTKTYTIEGNVEGINGPVTLAVSNVDLATTEAVDGKFTIVYKSASPEIAVLKLKSPFAWLLLEEGTINVTGNINDLRNITVGGTPSNDAKAALDKELNEIVDKVYHDESLTEEQREELVNKYDSLVEESYEANKGKNILGVYLLTSNMMYEMAPDQIIAAVEEYPAEIQSSTALKNAKSQAEAQKRVAVDQRFIEIEQNDPEGQPIKLSDVVAANKYTLVDFWASWCGPCMGEVPFLKADYAAYHDKGFEIYGVSLDRSKEDWVKCIANKGLVWPNVSEVNMWDNSAAKAYAVRSIPSNFLVARDGTIVATNLRGEALGAKLAELLK